MDNSICILKPADFDITKLKFGQVKQLNNGGKQVFLSYDNRKCYMQLPLMRAPFGVSVWPGDNGGPTKYDVNVSFDDMDTSVNVKKWFDVVQSIETKMIDSAWENSQTWFKKKYPNREVVEALFSPVIRYPKDRDTGEISNQYPPTMKLPLPVKHEDGKFAFSTYGSGREEIDLMDVIATTPQNTKGAGIQAIVQLMGIWVIGSKFGASFKVRQMKIATTNNTIPKYAFDDEEDTAASVPMKYEIESEEEENKENVAVKKEEEDDQKPFF